MVRVTYLVSHPIQYQAPFFRAVAAEAGVGLSVCFGCRWGVEPTLDPNLGVVADFGVDLLSGYAHRFLDHPIPPTLEGRFWALRARDIGALLGPTRPEVLVIHGWATALMWQGIGWARRRKIPVLVRGENPSFSNHPELLSAKRRLARAVLRHTFLRWATGLLVLGHANGRFYRRLGVPPAKFHRLPYFVDRDAVRRAAGKGREARAAIRAALGIPADAFVVVSIGKLMAKKRPEDLARLLGRLPARVRGIWIGSGAHESTARATAAAEGVEARLHFLGFRPPLAAWEILGACDLFFFPSADEKWGLVLNEALAAGLPALVSDWVGSAEDLIVRGRSGDVYPCGDIGRAAELAAEWIGRLPLQDGGPEQKVIMQKADEHGLAVAARLFADAVRSVAALEPSRLARFFPEAMLK